MPYIIAVVFTTWQQDAQGANVPNAIGDIFAWALANDEYLPEGQSGIGPFGRYEDVTAIVAPDIAVGKIFCAKMEVTVTTAQHFNGDPRIFTLGYRRYDDEGEVTLSNWDTTLTQSERTQVLDWLEAHGINRQEVAARFSATDTRHEILQKLIQFFKDR